MDVHWEQNDLCYTQVSLDATDVLPDGTEMFFTVITTFVETLLNTIMPLCLFPPNFWPSHIKKLINILCLCQRWLPTCEAVERDSKWCWKGTDLCWPAWLEAAGPCSTAGPWTTATSRTGRRSTGQVSPTAHESLLPPSPPSTQPRWLGSSSGRHSSFLLLCRSWHLWSWSRELLTNPPWCQLLEVISLPFHHLSCQGHMKRGVKGAKLPDNRSHVDPSW